MAFRFNTAKEIKKRTRKDAQRMMRRTVMHAIDKANKVTALKLEYRDDLREAIRNASKSRESMQCLKGWLAALKDSLNANLTKLATRVNEDGAGTHIDGINYNTTVYAVNYLHSHRDVCLRALSAVINESETEMTMFNRFRLYEWHSPGPGDDYRSYAEDTSLVIFVIERLPIMGRRV